MINDCLHTESTDDMEVRRRTVWENMNHRNLNGGPQADGGQVLIKGEGLVNKDFFRLMIDD